MALTGLGCSLRILTIPRAPITASPVLFSGGFGYTCLDYTGALSKLGITSKIPQSLVQATGKDSWDGPPSTGLGLIHSQILGAPEV